MKHLFEYNNWQGTNKTIREEWNDTIRPALFHEVLDEYNVSKVPEDYDARKESVGFFYQSWISKYSKNNNIIIKFYIVDQKSTSYFKDKFDNELKKQIDLFCSRIDNQYEISKKEEKIKDYSGPFDYNTKITTTYTISISNIYSI